ncbi:hypothetical protein VNI00_015936 [Paramarasmius palmivorus]|uniref:F-box domain-containing protein n=1 Tax=Paramarasmius palmivorus TaxID=297713 RepID=A0AAW0BGD8_9AGAR
MDRIVSVLFPHSRHATKNTYDLAFLINQPTANRLNDSMNDGVAVDRLLQYPPQDHLSSLDRAILLEYLRVSERELEGDLSLLGRLKADVSSLEEHSQALEQRINKCRSLLSPANKCPPEVLIEIFKHVCDINALELTLPPSALVLSGVCKTWRAILLHPSISSMHLWSSLYIPFRLWKNNPRALATITHVFLERSKNSNQLRLALDFSQVPGPFKTRFLPTITSLVEQSSRWTNLSLFMTPDIIQHPVFQPIRGNIPKLRRLEFFVTPGADDLQPLPLDMFEYAPNLCELDIYPRNSGDEGVFTLPRDQIINLSVGPWGTQPALRFISTFQSLSRLSITNIGGSRPIHESSLVLSQLQELHIFALETEQVNTIFHRSSFPSLSILEIEALGERDQSVDWTLPCLRDCISRSQCQITEIHLRDLPLCGTELFWLLSLTPAVHTLEVRTWHCAAESLRVLLNKSSVRRGPQGTDGGPLLPNLKDTNIGGFPETSTHRGMSKALARVITSRMLAFSRCSQGGCMRIDP